MNSLLLNIALAPIQADQLGMVIVGFLGASLVLAFLGLTGWVVRARYLVKSGSPSRICPRCNSSLHRVHRTRWEKFLCNTLNLPLGHYRCSNRHCHWQGLLRLNQEHTSKSPAPTVREVAASLVAAQAAASAAGPKVDLNQHGYHIETGAAPLPPEGPVLLERPSLPEVEDAPVMQ